MNGGFWENGDGRSIARWEFGSCICDLVDLDGLAEGLGCGLRVDSRRRCGRRERRVRAGESGHWGLRGRVGSWRRDADLEIGGPGLGRTFPEVLLIFADVRGNNPAQGLRAEGIGVFLLGDLDGEEERLCKIGKRGGGARLNVAASDGSEEAAEGGS